MPNFNKAASLSMRLQVSDILNNHYDWDDFQRVLKSKLNTYIILPTYHISEMSALLNKTFFHHHHNSNPFFLPFMFASNTEAQT